MHRPQTELSAALPERFIADWDSTVNTRYGHQEDAVVGYNPHKRGRRSPHPLICVAARTRLCLHLEWRPGDTVSATDWQPAMENSGRTRRSANGSGSIEATSALVRRRSWRGTKPKERNGRNICSSSS